MPTINASLPEWIIKAVEKYQEERGMTNKSAAVQELICKGLGFIKE